MSKVRCFRVEKLIRDKMPDILKDNNIEFDIINLPKSKFISKLKEKLIEEATEIFNAKSHEEYVEEFADLLEVFESLYNMLEISFEEIKQVKFDKKEKKGGFNLGIYNKFVAMNEGNPNIEYYLNKSKEYPEII